VSEITAEPRTSSAPGLESTGLKNERIGQSVLTAEISVWSGINGKGGYAATVIFFLTVLAISLYVFLRLIGVDRSMAGRARLWQRLSLPSPDSHWTDFCPRQASSLFFARDGKKIR
jgi:hypothetical protein